MAEHRALNPVGSMRKTLRHRLNHLMDYSHAAWSLSTLIAGAMKDNMMEGLFGRRSLSTLAFSSTPANSLSNAASGTQPEESPTELIDRYLPTLSQREFLYLSSTKPWESSAPLLTMRAQVESSRSRIQSTSVNQSLMRDSMEIVSAVMETTDCNGSETSSKSRCYSEPEWHRSCTWCWRTVWHCAPTDHE